MSKHGPGLLLVTLMALAAPSAAQTRASELRIYDEEGEQLAYDRLTARERSTVDATADSLRRKSPGGEEPAGCVAGSGMIYCWAFGYICVAFVSPSPDIMCAACVEPSNCE